MEIKDFIAKLEQNNFMLMVDGDKLILKAGRKKVKDEQSAMIKRDPEVIDYIRNNKGALIEYLNSIKVQNRNGILSIYKLSPLQAGMMFHDLYDDDAAAYRNQLRCDLYDLDLALFKKAWEFIIRQHTILRTSFHYDSFKIPVQCVHADVHLPLEVVDLTHFDEEEKQRQLAIYEGSDQAKPFDFKTAPLMRVTLLRLDSRTYRMLWSSHHILLDGWSRPVLMEEFLTVYESLYAGRTVVASEEDRFEDFIRFIEQRDKEAEKTYWINSLRTLSRPCLLPFILPSLERTKSVRAFADEVLSFDAKVKDGIEGFARRHRITVNTFMQGAWSLLLHRYTAGREVAFGVVVSGRPENFSNVERRVGMYINTVPLISTIDSKQAVPDWLRNIQEQQHILRKYQFTPLAEIQKWSGIKGDLFDTLMVFQNFPLSRLASSGAWTLRAENIAGFEQSSNFPLLIRVSVDTGISIQLIYKRDLLSVDYVRLIKSHLEHVIQQLMVSDGKQLQDIQLASPQEVHKILHQFAGTSEVVPGTTLVQLFRENFEHKRGKIAIEFLNDRLTYDELDERSRRVAASLVAKGVGKGSIVPLYCNKSPQMVVAMMAILRAGAAYLPIGKNDPEARILKIVNQSCSAIGVCDVKSNVPLECAHGTVHWFTMDDLMKEAIAPSGDETLPAASDLAYVIFTSGTTGQPKGVMIEHQSIANYIQHQLAAYDIDDKERILQFSDYTFDASVEQIFLPLCSGGTLVLLPEDLRSDKDLFEQFLADQRITHLHATPSYLRMLSPGRYGGLKRVVCGGEVCDIELANNWKKICRFYNKYGPTEASVSVCCYVVEKENALKYPSVPIGTPVANTRFYVLDPLKQPVAIGEPGELYIGGIQVARGYLNSQELTDQSFPSNLLGRHERVYKTGDLVRWLPDGKLIFVRRNDAQVKIRGYRIEPGEIERVLCDIPGVRSALVMAVEQVGQLPQLAAFVMKEGHVDQETVRQFLCRYLNEYMIPSRIIQVNEFPLTTSGKIDTRTLTQWALSESGNGAYEAPVGEAETSLAAIWGELLAIENVGRHDNYFELGGDSIISIQVVSRARKLGYQLQVVDLFVHQTIAKIMAAFETRSRLATSLRGGHEPPGPAASHKRSPGTAQDFDLPPGIDAAAFETFLDEQLPAGSSRRETIEGCYRLSSLQSGMLFHSLYDPTGAMYRNQLKCTIRNIHQDAFLRTWNILMEHHTIFRSSFHHDVFSIPVQCVHKHVQLPLEVLDYSGYDILRQSEAIEAFEKDDLEKGFDFKSAPLMRVTLIRLGADRWRMLWTSHHLLHDGWSLPILMEEFLSVYDRVVKGEEVPVPVVDKYEDYIKIIEARDKDAEEKYWSSYLHDLQEGTLFPFIQSTVNRKNAVGEYKEEVLNLHTEVAASIRTFAKTKRVTLNTLMQGVWALLLHHYTGKPDICFGVVVSGRPETMERVEERVGMYINTLPLRSTIEPDNKIGDWLHQLFQDQLRSRDNQYASLSELQLLAGVHGGLFDTTMAFQNFPVSKILHGRSWELEVDDLFVKEQSNYPLYITIGAFEEINIHFFYNTALFSSSIINKIKFDFRNVLMQFLDPHRQLIRHIDPVTPTERDRLLFEYNSTQRGYSFEKTVVDLFTDQALLTPESVCVKGSGIQLTYEALHVRSSQLAHHLRSVGVEQETLVPVLLNPSVHMMVAILGILKAGGAYVPIDPQLPGDRIRYILTDVGANVLIADAAVPDVDPDILVIPMDSGKGFAFDTAPAMLLNHAKPDSLAYTIYTSGSTGQPKGVLVEHKSLLNYLLNSKELYCQREAPSGTFSFLSPTFDASLTALFTPLIAGKMLIIGENSAFEVFDDTTFADNASYCFLKLTPAHLRLLTAHYKGKEVTNHIVVGGEQLKYEDVAFLAGQSGVTIYNEYGPTEATVGCCLYAFAPDNRSGNEPVPIGKPMNNVQLFVLNEDGALITEGAVGELHIGGVQVARGYLNKEQLTKEKFIDNPFGEGRLFKTGDLVRWLPDGNLQFRGRKDEQVKIRGHRVEPAEVETVLRRKQGIKDAVVLAEDNQKLDKRLVAYVVPGEDFQRDQIKPYLRSLLPDFLIPDLVVEVNEIPLTINGKIDKKALRATRQSYKAGDDHVLPTNPTEDLLAAAWREVLELDTISIHDDFFRIGGNSLLAISAISLMRKTMDIEVPISVFFELATIDRLAKFIDSRQGHEQLNEQGYETIKL